MTDEQHRRSQWRDYLDSSSKEDEDSLSKEEKERLKSEIQQSSSQRRNSIDSLSKEEKEMKEQSRRKFSRWLVATGKRTQWRNFLKSLPKEERERWKWAWFDYRMEMKADTGGYTIIPPPEWTPEVKYRKKEL